MREPKHPQCHQNELKSTILNTVISEYLLLYTICPVPVVNINILRLGKSHKTVLFTDILKIQQKASIKLTLQLSILPGVRIV